MTTITSVTFLAQEIRRRAARQFLKRLRSDVLQSETLRNPRASDRPVSVRMAVVRIFTLAILTLVLCSCAAGFKMRSSDHTRCGQAFSLASGTRNSDGALDAIAIENGGRSVNASNKG